MNNVCTNCFSDRELKAYIDIQSNKGECTFCGTSGIEIIDVCELYDFFKELLDNFQKKENGQPLKNLIQGNWSLFSSAELSYSILNFVIHNIDTDILSSDDFVDFNEDIFENVNYWDKLKEQLIWERRYLTDINYLTDELGWDGFFNSQIALTKETVLYRARLHNKSEENSYTHSEMFCPPKKISSAGRANSRGIPFLYLSDNRETILYEIRASYLDEISIGTFALKDDLKELIYISDFTESPTIFHPSRVNERIKSTLLKQKISVDLSKPMRRYDSELDYIPTQFICEFIKIYTGVKGIKFRSSLHTMGNNLVLFDQEIVQCNHVEKVRVKKVQISI
ncbi:RES family NAD+ phosphorylase [Flavobacterium branchiarum]|uniref:RES family NAD+ phosphorylase n=1 Tax=Flavobacterium branchiarum TaxID=1114870 RepID=A0ABV5FL51_9FLAO|nr:RES family NAD+ phosphorylase [Flavobacterium branchiarum]MDN3672436.1 RES family NAD+ phosphorylase [Flavobacterium branchiarum]